HHHSGSVHRVALELRRERQGRRIKADRSLTKWPTAIGSSRLLQQNLPLPDVAAEDVVQLVSCFSLDGVVDCATAAPASNEPAKIAAPTRLIILSLLQTKRSCS
ncbi:MAG TPA: hypothetical protein VGJ68_10460, partial [Bradyrhizobium sp.]